MKYIIVLLLLCPSIAQAVCDVKYKRSDYKHWISTPESLDAGLKDVRQLAIAKAVVSGLEIKNGRVISGLWHDLYTGKLYKLDEVKPDGEHLISLAWASARGGLCATKKQREALANDIQNIWAVHPSANRKKGARVSDYLPPNLGICKEYLAQIKKVIQTHDWIKPTSEDVDLFEQTEQKCHEIRNGIFIKKQLRWFERIFK